MRLGSGDAGYLIHLFRGIYYITVPSREEGMGEMKISCSPYVYIKIEAKNYFSGKSGGGDDFYNI